jgi:hypothetical protein
MKGCPRRSSGGISRFQNLRLTSFEIANMNMNIPTDELLNIIESSCQNNDVESLKPDILKLLKVVIDQNYFQFMDQT